MKTITKIIATLTLCVILAPAAFADVIANPDYPYNASEAVTMFDQLWDDGYDKINEDLHATEAVAKEQWFEGAMVAQFHITFADGIDNGYTFDFMNRDDTAKIYNADPLLDDETPWHYEETDNTDNLLTPLSNVNLTLRKLIPAMQSDVRLLEALDRGIAEESDTSMFITLKEDENQVSTWYIEFRVANDDPAKNKTYLVWVSAEDAAKPLFKTVRKD